MNNPLENFRSLLDGLLRVAPQEGPSRVMGLSEAIARYVRPGQALHTLVTHTFPYGLVNETARQCWRKDPGFTLVTLAAANHAVLMLRGGLLTRLVTSYCGDIYPAPGPNPIFSEAYSSGRVVIENWTVLTYTLRLMAGALGLPGLPTRSLLGSTMAEDNREAFALVTDPFGHETTGFVKALRPDLTLVHGWVADPAGNVLFSPPLSENLWGAVAAREGAVVSVEKIVDTDFIRAHAHLTRLPAQFVRAVVELPFGAHPGGFFGRPIRNCSSYAEDYDFIVDFRAANRDDEKFAAWLDRWVLGCPTHQEYLKRVGPSRLADLVQKGRPDSWESELAALASGISSDPGAAPSERMTVEAARRLVSRCRSQGHRNILAGQGVSNLAAWLASYLLKREGLEVDLVAETGLFGYAPRPGSPFLFNFANVPRCKMLSDSLWTLGALVGGASARCIGSLSAGQVDRTGNINSTLIPGTFFLVGSGGACDVLNTASEVLICAPLAPMRFLEKVPYVTGPGTRVTCVVTDRCVFEKEPGDHELVLAALFREGDRSKEDLVEEIRGLLGWVPRTRGELPWLEPPGIEELMTIRLLDPRRAFLKLPR